MMDKINLYIILLILMIGCKQMEYASIYKNKIGRVGNKIIVGIPTFIDTKNTHYWDSINLQFEREFNLNYAAYNPNKKLISKIKQFDFNGKIKIMGGAWCTDTRLELPILCRILDEVEIDPRKINYIGLNKEKKSFFTFSQNQVTDLVPTVIFYDSTGNVTGTIKEHPSKNWENEVYKYFKNMIPTK